VCLDFFGQQRTESGEIRLISDYLSSTSILARLRFQNPLGVIYLYRQHLQASADSETPRESPKDRSAYFRMVFYIVQKQLVDPPENVTDEVVATASRHVPDETKTTSF
jgi:hypothetical protein